MEPRQTKGREANSGGASSSATALALSSDVSELNQLALWMAATLAGVVTAALTARTPFFRSVLRRLGPGPAKLGPPRARRPSRERSLPMLAEAVIGSSKSAIASVLGPPGSAVLMHTAPGATYWQADTWYYPLPKSGPLAMAIEFAGDDARTVEFLRAPEA